MSREIKFRGFQESWICGGINIRENEEGVLEARIFCEYDMAYQVDINSVGQFTGLHDKNGKEIFEGDLIKFRANYCYTDQVGTHISEVVFKDLMWHLQVKINDELQCMDFDMNKNGLEIIGNIHQNPELLK